VNLPVESRAADWNFENRHSSVEERRRWSTSLVVGACRVASYRREWQSASNNSALAAETATCLRRYKSANTARRPIPAATRRENCRRRSASCNLVSHVPSPQHHCHSLPSYVAVLSQRRSSSPHSLSKPTQMIRVSFFFFLRRRWKTSLWESVALRPWPSKPDQFVARVWKVFLWALV